MLQTNLEPYTTTSATAYEPYTLTLHHSGVNLLKTKSIPEKTQKIFQKNKTLCFEYCTI